MTTESKNEETTALAEAEKEIESGERALATIPRSITEPTNFEQAWTFAQIVARSGMFGVKTPEDAFVRMSTGMTLGLPAIQALNLIDAIPGADGSTRPALRAKLKVALIRRSKVCEYFRCVETTDKHATYETKRRGEPVLRYTYELKEAEAAGYTKKNNWKENGRSMLRARASSHLAEMEYSDVTGGLTSTEEAYDHETTAKPVTEWSVTVVNEHVEKLSAAIESAKDKPALDKAYADAKSAKEKGDITLDEFEAMKKRAGERKAELLGGAKGDAAVATAPTTPAPAAEAGAPQS